MKFFTINIILYIRNLFFITSHSITLSRQNAVSCYISTIYNNDMWQETRLTYHTSITKVSPPAPPSDRLYTSHHPGLGVRL